MVQADARTPMSPGTACDVVLRHSLETLSGAERELDDVLKQLEADTLQITGRIKKRSVFGVLLLVVAVLASPGLLLSLRSLGIVDIKEGTYLWKSVLAWEFAFDSVASLSRRWVSMELARTACAWQLAWHLSQRTRRAQKLVARTRPHASAGGVSIHRWGGPR